MTREIFEAKMAELKASQGKSGTMFSNEEYQQYRERLKAISQPGYEMKHVDYYLVKRFKILRVELMGRSMIDLSNLEIVSCSNILHLKAQYILGQSKSVWLCG